MNSHEVFIHIHQGCFAGTGAIARLPQCQWSKPDGYGEISQCITTTKHSKAKTVCIFLGIYCTSLVSRQPYDCPGTLVPVKQPWKIWVNVSRGLRRIDIIITKMESTTKLRRGTIAHVSRALYHHHKDRLYRWLIPMIKIRCSWDRLIFVIAISLLLRRQLYIEMNPVISFSRSFVAHWISHLPILHPSRQPHDDADLASSPYRRWHHNPSQIRVSSVLEDGAIEPLEKGADDLRYNCWSKRSTFSIW